MQDLRLERLLTLVREAAVKLTSGAADFDGACLDEARERITDAERLVEELQAEQT